MRYAALGATAILTISERACRDANAHRSERRGSGHRALKEFLFETAPLSKRPRVDNRRHSRRPGTRAWTGEHARAPKTSASGYPGTPRAHGPRGSRQRPASRPTKRWASVLEPGALRDARSLRWRSCTRSARSAGTGAGHDAARQRIRHPSSSPMPGITGGCGVGSRWRGRCSPVAGPLQGPAAPPRC